VKPDEWLVRFNLSTEHADEYDATWATRCPQCGVPSGLCLTNSGHPVPRPHAPRRRSSAQVRKLPQVRRMRVEEPT
jgi:hypothetical protein